MARSRDTRIPRVFHLGLAAVKTQLTGRQGL